jgi:hypothetical protein
MCEVEIAGYMDHVEVGGAIRAGFGPRRWDVCYACLAAIEHWLSQFIISRRRGES